MFSTGFIKRFLPFALTFAAGLFIASFFMPIGLSRSGSCHHGRHRDEFRELKMKYEQSEEENFRLRIEMYGVKSVSPVLDQEFEIDAELPLVPPPPIAPPAPRRHR